MFLVIFVRQNSKSRHKNRHPVLSLHDDEKNSTHQPDSTQKLWEKQLLLLRSSRNGAFSSPCLQHLTPTNIAGRDFADR